MTNNVKPDNDDSMNKNSRLSPKLLWLIATIVICLVTLIGYLIINGKFSFSEDSGANLTDGSAPLLSQQSQAQKAIKQQWQWTEIKYEDEAPAAVQESQLPFTAESVYQALQEVKITKDGDIVLDHTTLISLDEALERIYKRLDSNSLAILQQLITDALPGTSGQQTAKLVADYYHFLLAKHEFSRMYEPLVAHEGAPTVESIASQQSLYQELQGLREVHLGDEVATSLFQASDADANFMFENMKLDADVNLTPEQRQIRRKEIQETFIEQSITIDDWPSRYRSFLQQKQSISRSELAQSDKESELKELYNQHFNGSEQQKIAHLRLDKIINTLLGECFSHGWALVKVKNHRGYGLL